MLHLLTCLEHSLMKCNGMKEKDQNSLITQVCNYKDKFVSKKPSYSISSLDKNIPPYQTFSLKLHNSKILRHTGSVCSVSGTCYSGAVYRRVYVSVHILLCEKLNGRFSHDYLPKSKKPSFNAYVALKNKENNSSQIRP